MGEPLYGRRPTDTPWGHRPPDPRAPRRRWVIRVNGQVPDDKGDVTLETHLSEINQFAITDTVTGTFLLSHVPVDKSWNVTRNGITLRNLTQEMSAGTDYANPSPTGVTTISGSPSTTESVVSGMDLTGDANTDTDVVINLWESMQQPSVVKGCTARLRAGSATGTILASHVFTDAGDSTAGHQQQWSYTGTHQSPNGRFVVTIQATTGAPTIYADTRTFTLHQAGHLVDVGDYSISGRVLTIRDPASCFAGVATQAPPWLLEVQYDYLPSASVITDISFLDATSIGDAHRGASISVPALTGVGDTLVLFAVGSQPYVAPTGFTQRFTQAAMTMWTKSATAGDLGGSVTINSVGGVDTRLAAVLVTLRGSPTLVSSDSYDAPGDRSVGSPYPLVQLDSQDGDIILHAIFRWDGSHSAIGPPATLVAAPSDGGSFGLVVAREDITADGLSPAQNGQYIFVASQLMVSAFLFRGV